MMGSALTRIFMSVRVSIVEGGGGDAGIKLAEEEE